MHPSENWFREWFNSPYYHRLYAGRNEEEAGAFIDGLITHLHPPKGSLMLDVACGRGRHARMLAAKGFDVTGIDLAPDNIAYALESAGENLHFYEHDMRMPFWINYFDYAFNFFTSFGYFKTAREHNNTLRTVSQSLKRKAVFVLDYLNVQYTEDHLVHESVSNIDGSTFHLTRWFDENSFYKKIVVEDAQLKEPLFFTEKVARFTLAEFEEMFALQGLKIKEIFGDYQLHNFDLKKSPRLLMIAEKQAGS